MEFTKLFTPIKVGGIETKNRIIFSPIVSNLATEEGFISEKNLRHYEERAKGGAGIVIVEATAIIPKVNRRIMIFDDQFLPGLIQLSSCIKSHGAKAFIQLFHPGPKADITEHGVSASEIPIRDFRPKCLETDEVYELIQQFVNASVRSKAAGFDGIELHTAHFYLLSAFLSPYTNTRNDEFGGNTENRVKIVCDIIKGIKERVGADFPILCRINAVETLENGMTLEESKQVAKLLASAGANAIDVSAYDRPLSPTYHGMAISVGGLCGEDVPKGPFVPYAAEIKGAVEVPVVAVSKLDDPVFANHVLEESKADLIAIGRGLLADPYLPQKAQEGNLEEINWCTYCGVCHTNQQRGREIRCPVNKNLGK